MKKFRNEGKCPICEKETLIFGKIKISQKIMTSIFCDKCVLQSIKKQKNSTRIILKKVIENESARQIQISLNAILNDLESMYAREDFLKLKGK